MDISLIPEYKRISYTNIVVDCFYIDIVNASHYFLSHFHSDHYHGIKRSFQYPVYCSVTTANLLQLKYKTKTIPLVCGKIYHLDTDISVSVVDANHCPGASCFVFSVQGYYILHTGDFRCTYDWTKQFLGYKFSTIYLDNTFEGHKAFPSQEAIIHRVLDLICDKRKHNCVVPIKYQYLFCTYCIGKEKMFLCVAQYFDFSILVTKDKYNIYKCYDNETIALLNDEVLKIVKNYRNKNVLCTKNKLNIRRTSIQDSERVQMCVKYRQKARAVVTRYNKITDYFRKKTVIQEHIYDTELCNVINNQVAYHKEQTGHVLPFARITTEEKEDQIMVISTQHIQKDKIHKILEGNKNDRAIAFCVTGWSDKCVLFDWIKSNGRVMKKAIEIVHVPYSEHSSSDELKQFKCSMTYDRIINTVKYKRKNEYD